MIIVVATIRVKPGRTAQYEAVIRDIMPRVRAANPELVFYRAAASRDEPDTYRVIEAYATQEAMDRHMASPLLAEAIEALSDHVEGIEIKLHDELEAA